MANSRKKLRSRKSPKQSRKHSRKSPKQVRKYSRKSPKQSRKYSRKSPKQVRKYSRKSPKQSRKYSRKSPKQSRKHSHKHSYRFGVASIVASKIKQKAMPLIKSGYQYAKKYGSQVANEVKQDLKVQAAQQLNQM
jgi:hypothetical protein